MTKYRVRQGLTNLFNYHANEYRKFKIYPEVWNLQNSFKIVRFLSSVSFCCNGPIKTEVGVHCYMMKAIPIKKKTTQKQLKGCWDQICMGGCPDMTSCTSIAEVKDNPSHPECLYHSLEFVLLAYKCLLTPVSFHQPMPRGCCVSHTVPSQIQMSTQAVWWDHLTFPEHVRKCSWCVISLACVVGATLLLIPVCFFSVLCCHKVVVMDLVRFALVLHITAEQAWE